MNYFSVPWLFAERDRLFVPCYESPLQPGSSASTPWPQVLLFGLKSPFLPKPLSSFTYETEFSG